jgi:hypothetical protein
VFTQLFRNKNITPYKKNRNFQYTNSLGVHYKNRKKVILNLPRAESEKPILNRVGEIIKNHNMSEVTKVRDDIKAWSETLLAVTGTGAVAAKLIQFAWGKIKGCETKIDAIENCSDWDPIELADLTAELLVDAAEAEAAMVPIEAAA